MPKILNKTGLLVVLLVLTTGCLCLFVAHSSAAEFSQASYFEPGGPGTFGAAEAVDDVQMVVTTYRDGKVFQTTATVERPRSSDSSIAGAAPAAANQPAAAGDIVVSQIYSNGGNPGSTYQNNYLELFNRTDNAIDFGGWRIYAASANGPFDQAISFVSSRGIAIGGHQYLLIRFGPESANGAPVPSDLAGPTSAPSPPPGVPPFPLFNLSPSGKVFLTMPNVNVFGSACPLPNPEIVDFVGYGATASCFEGTGPTGTTSNTTAALRKAGGCTDSNNNADDFDVSATSPRNSLSPQNFCGTPPPAVIQFSQASFSVTESSGSIGVLVTRTVNTTGVSKVDYTTSDTSGANNCEVVSGNASSRCDYLTEIGTLEFAAGETFKLIGIPLIDDAYAEGPENFTVNLSNPTAATLGTPSTATVVLNDNDSTNGINPIDQTGFFVRQHYIDFLNREPDNAGNSFWIGEINNCTPKPDCTELKRINVSAAFFLSIEFQQTGYLVYRTYKAAYGNMPNAPVPLTFNEFLPNAQQMGHGFVVNAPGWEQQLEANKNVFFLDFVSRLRFRNDYPTTMSPTQFVDQLLSRAAVTPSDADRSAAIDEFGSATDTVDTDARRRALRRVAENSILTAQERNPAFVLMQYFGYLRRNPNDSPEPGLNFDGFNFWLAKLNQFNGNFVNADMVKAFIVSSEYRNRFGP